MTTRTYPVPRAVAASSALVDTPISARLASGRPVDESVLRLASADTEWAASVCGLIDRIRRRPLLAAGVPDNPGCSYLGIADPRSPDADMLTSLVRVDPAADVASGIERWTGAGWETVPAELEPEGFRYVELDPDTLADLIAAITQGGGLALRASVPRGWLRGVGPTSPAAIAAAADHSGAMVALFLDEPTAKALAVPGGEPPEDLHVTLAYLGESDEIAEYDVRDVLSTVSKWASSNQMLEGEVSGRGLFTAGDEPVAYASVDIPGLAEARTDLVRALEDAGTPARTDHGFTPHITLKYSKEDIETSAPELKFDRAVVAWGNDRYELPLGTPIVGAAPPAPALVVAVVDDYDTSAVLELLQVAPGPVVSRRQDGAWVPDPSFLAKLQSVDPPAVASVPLDRVDSIIEQVDQFDADRALTAAAWDESKYHREGGKFAPKDGSGSSYKAGSQAPVGDMSMTERQQQIADYIRGGGKRPEGIKPQDKAKKAAGGGGSGGARRARKSAGAARGTADPAKTAKEAVTSRLEALRGKWDAEDAESSDRDWAFDIAVAESGIAEERKRLAFDDGVRAEYEQLVTRGVPADEISAQLGAKLRAETQRRDKWNRARKVQADNEKIRRMKAKRATATTRARQRAALKSASLTAAGKPATTRMPAKLVDYWARGAGRAKIRWGIGGDFGRCRRQLARYLPPQMVSGACANLHKIATGTWPGKGREH